MISWHKNLDRKTFNAFEVPKHVRNITNFKDKESYTFRLSAGDFTCIQSFKMTSGLEVSIPINIQDKIKKASTKVSALRFEWNEHATTLKDFDTKVSKALKDTSSTRKKRLKKANKKPKSKLVSIIVFERNQDVVAEVLIRAEGNCENCKNAAPFLREKDNSPYLEVHHIIRLADGGDDTVENAEALCPNCHREKHFG